PRRARAGAPRRRVALPARGSPRGGHGGDRRPARWDSGSGAVAVAEAAHRLDRRAVGLHRFQLAAEVADVELHLVAADAVRVAPHELEELLAGENELRVADERGEQAELERRELHLAVGDGNASLRPV